MQPHLDILLSSAIRSIIHPFSNRSDALRFLSSHDLEKPNDLRLFAWLVVFDLVPTFPGKWASSIHGYFTSYFEKLPRASDPLSSLGEADARVIRADTSRSVLWFIEMSRDPAFSVVPTANAEFMANRILSTMRCPYAQGYDRYVFVTLLLALDFCARADLSPDVGEALAFHLSQKFIGLTGIIGFLMDPAATQAHFERMDQDLAAYAPEWIASLRRARQGSIHFALRWELLLFADEYPIKELLLIWDHALKWKTEYTKFLYSLCISHVKYTPLPRQNEIPIEVLQSYRGWDIIQVIDDAEARMVPRPKNYKYVWIALICVGMMMLIIRYFI
jgi:hypothetical protein